jgi:cyclopropane fatty-acyl-phospholipid synthase-like methyltransferase
MLGFSQAADNNKASILTVLSKYLQAGDVVLEVGSGSGQHALHMAQALPYVTWYPSEHPAALDTLKHNIKACGSDNIATPLSIDLAKDTWQKPLVDVVYAANITHIVTPLLGERLVALARNALSGGGLLALYGPFKYAGAFTSESNARFEQWLKGRDPRSGIRDFEWMLELASGHDMTLIEDHTMPANNQLLVFQSRKI